MIPVAVKIGELQNLVDELREIVNELKEKEQAITYTHEDLVKLNNCVNTIMIKYLLDRRVKKELFKAAYDHIVFLLKYANDFHKLLNDRKYNRR